MLIVLLIIAIKSGVSPFLHGNTAKLCEAIEEGNNKAAIDIAEKTNDLNRPSTIVPRLTTFVEGEVTTPLVKACETGNAEIIIWLLDHGARTDYAPVNMLYPLETFCDSGSGAGIDALKALLDHGADPELYKDRPPVFRLAQTLRHGDWQTWPERVDMILLLLDNGAAWQDPTDGYTLLHYAALQDNGSFLRTLLEWDESAQYINARNNEGKTPLDIAVQNQNTECAFLLQERTGQDNGRAEEEAINRSIIANALGSEDENSRAVTKLVNYLNTIDSGRINEADLVDGNKLDIIAESGTVYRIYLTSDNAIEAVENRNTGEWLAQSYR